jgi:hypothetical protein
MPLDRDVDAHEKICMLQAAPLQGVKRHRDVGQGGISWPLICHVLALDSCLRNGYALERSLAEERASAADDPRETTDQTARLERQREEETAVLANVVDAFARCGRVRSSLEHRLTAADLELENAGALLTDIASRSPAAAGEALPRNFRADAQEKKHAHSRSVTSAQAANALKSAATATRMGAAAAKEAYRQHHAGSAALAQAVKTLEATVAAARMGAAAAKEAHGKHLRRHLEDSATRLPAEHQALADTVDVPAPSTAHEDEADEVEVSRLLLIDAGIVSSTSDVEVLAARHANDSGVASTSDAGNGDNLCAPDGTAAAPEPNDDARQFIDRSLPPGPVLVMRCFPSDTDDSIKAMFAELGISTTFVSFRRRWARGRHCTAFVYMADVHVNNAIARLHRRGYVATLSFNNVACQLAE